MIISMCLPQEKSWSNKLNLQTERLLCLFAMKYDSSFYLFPLGAFDIIFALAFTSSPNPSQE